MHIYVFLNIENLNGHVQLAFVTTFCLILCYSSLKYKQKGTPNFKICVCWEKIEKSASINLSFPADWEKTNIIPFFINPLKIDQVLWNLVLQETLSSPWIPPSDNNGCYHIICYTLVSK